uniref:Uncharacterized protein n=1 Tax=Tetradesmus obliquus TaxID=3088 RepID=A0A383W345_TETOB|eukprot:jgi/Sobl393_1/1121/SZX72075.1
MQNMKLAVFLVLFSLAGSLPSSFAARLLLQQDGYVGAKTIKPSRSSSSATRSALTPETAEATANAAFGGVHRMMTPSSKRSYATVDATETNVNSNNRVTGPRARSAQDLTRGGPNRGNGPSSMPALTMGQVSHASTYEGASSTAASDSLALNRGGDRSRVAISGNLLTTRTGSMRGASRTASWGVTMQPVGSKALSGAANSHIVLAQADSAVAYAQAERN